jgi:NAD(P)-dependent dehydrogenase (short-subunit alcohol dehydrogenase family)
MNDFGRDTTTDEVLEGLDLSGRRFTITGAASGLGSESARALAAHGASVTLLARSADRADEAAAKLRMTVPDADLSTGVVDLADLATIRSWVKDNHDAVDVLINNAGVMACPFGRTADGFETQFGTNHLGHFLLTALLLPALRRGNSPRVVTLSSGGHSLSDVDLVDPNFEQTEYSAWIAYGRSKTANALFARELSRRGGSGLLSFSVHPGTIVTDLGRHLTPDLTDEMFAFSRAASDAKSEKGAGGFHFKSIESGAATQVWAATAPGLEAHNGAYLANCGLGVLGANPADNGFRAHLLDDDHAAELWQLSETMVGERFET